MTVVYLDEVFLLNTAVDYLLLSAAARLTGEPLRRGRMVLAAALGGGYAALIFLPGWGSLAHPLCQVALAWAMVLGAFWSSRRLFRVGLVFLGVSAGFGGAVLALRLFWGGNWVLDLRTALLAAAVCCLFFSLVFHRAALHTVGDLAALRLELGGKVISLTALRDTGNTLSDPLSGQPVAVVQGERLFPLFPPGTLTREKLKDPLQALTQGLPGRGWRVVPYRTVGRDKGLLLCCRVDRATAGGEDLGSMLVALSPEPVSDGGGYQALLGERRGPD